jgi:hypothetical protein
LTSTMVLAQDRIIRSIEHGSIIKETPKYNIPLLNNTKYSSEQGMLIEYDDSDLFHYSRSRAYAYFYSINNQTANIVDNVVLEFDCNSTADFQNDLKVTFDPSQGLLMDPDIENLFYQLGSGRVTIANIQNIRNHYKIELRPQLIKYIQTQRPSEGLIGLVESPELNTEVGSLIFSDIQFRLRYAVPPIPLTQGGLVDTFTPTLKWSSSGKGLKYCSYSVQVSDVSSAGTVLWAMDDIQRTSIEVPPGVLTAGHQYNWKVVTKSSIHSDVANSSITESFQLSNEILEISPTAVVVGDIAGTAPLEVSSNMNWQSVTTEPWLQVNPQAGNGFGTVNVSYDSNPFALERTAQLIVTAGSLTKMAKITQSSAPPNLSVTPITHDVSVNTGHIDLDITTNTQWRVLSDNNWLSLSETTGIGDASIRVNYEANRNPLNPTYSMGERVGTIDVEGGGLSSTSQITQAGIPSKLEVSQTSIKLRGRNPSATFHLRSNLEWQIEEDEDWFYLNSYSGIGDKTIVITAESSSFAMKTGTVIIRASDLVVEIQVSTF